MRAEGIALCARCHGEYLAIWREEDAASERAELLGEHILKEVA